MSTIFDFITVGCFGVVVLIFFRFTDRGIQTLLNVLLACLLFAVANQLGNAGSVILASVLISAGIVWVTLAAQR